MASQITYVARFGSLPFCFGLMALAQLSDLGASAAADKGVRSAQSVAAGASAQQGAVDGDEAADARAAADLNGSFDGDEQQSMEETQGDTSTEAGVSSCYLACYASSGKPHNVLAEGVYRVGLLAVPGAYDDALICRPLTTDGELDLRAHSDHTPATAALCAPAFGRPRTPERSYWTGGDTFGFWRGSHSPAVVSFERTGAFIEEDDIAGGIAPYPCVR